LGNNALPGKINNLCTDNIALGNNALSNISTGSNNIAIGNNSGTIYTTESNNILIGSTGIIGDSGVIRIGTQTNSAIHIPTRSPITNIQYNDMYYYYDTDEVVASLPPPVITIEAGTDNGITSWNNQVRNKPLIHNTTVIFPSYTSSGDINVNLPSINIDDFIMYLTVIACSRDNNAATSRVVLNNTTGVIYRNTNNNVSALSVNKDSTGNNIYFVMGSVKLMYFTLNWYLISGINYH